MSRPARATALLALLVLAACGVEAGRTDPTAAPVSPSPATPTTLLDEPVGADPATCDDASAVGEAVGASVEGFPTEGTGFSSEAEHTYAGCSYTSFDDDAVGFIDVERLTATDPGERRLFDLLDGEARAAAWRDGFEPVDDLGDGAYLDGTSVVVRAGDVLLFADYEPADLGELAAPTPAIELARAALELDLSVDRPPTCDEVEPLVADAIGAPTASRTSSGFLGVNEVSLTTAGCAVDLADGATASVAVADAAPWDAWVAAKESFDLRATYEATTIGGRPAFDDGRRLVVDDQVAGAAHRPWVIDTGLWEGDPTDGAARRAAIAAAVIDG